jgi:hypothetical protein
MPATASPLVLMWPATYTGTDGAVS